MKTAWGRAWESAYVYLFGQSGHALKSFTRSSLIPVLSLGEKEGNPDVPRNADIHYFVSRSCDNLRSLRGSRINVVGRP